MIDTEQSITIDRGIAQIWEYVRDMRRWAAMMPGMRDYMIIDEDNSRWTLKVGVGGMVRTVFVGVHVDRWAGPGRVDFSYQLEGDPVSGGGCYSAVSRSVSETDITLQIRVEGSGPMAAMWEAMGRPLLPGFVKSFAAQLKQEIESADGGAAMPAVRATPFTSLWRWLQSCLRRITQRP